MNTLLRFKLAKLLTEKSIKIDTEEVLFYRDEVNNIEEHQIKNRDTVYRYTGMDPYPTLDENEYQTYTIADVVMWLYEKYEVWISVVCDAGNDLLFTFKIYSTTIGEESCIANGNMYSTPTQAYEAAIEHCLKRI